MYHATVITRPALSVTTRWASGGRGAGAPTSTAIAGEAKRVAAAETPAPLPAAAGSQHASEPTSRAAAAAELQRAPTGSGALKLYVQRMGDPDFVKLLSRAADVDDLRQEIVQKLKVEAPLSTVTLHVAHVNEETGAVLRVEEAALPSRKALAALPALQSGASIVVKVAGTLAVPTSAGGEPTAALASPARSPAIGAASGRSSPSYRPRLAPALLTRSQAEPVQP